MAPGTRTGEKIFAARTPCRPLRRHIPRRPATNSSCWSHQLDSSAHITSRRRCVNLLHLISLPQAQQADSNLFHPSHLLLLVVAGLAVAVAVRAIGWRSTFANFANLSMSLKSQLGPSDAASETAACRANRWRRLRVNKRPQLEAPGSSVVIYQVVATWPGARTCCIIGAEIETEASGAALSLLLDTFALIPTEPAPVGGPTSSRAPYFMATRRQ